MGIWILGQTRQPRVACISKAAHRQVVFVGRATLCASVAPAFPDLLLSRGVQAAQDRRETNREISLVSFDKTHPIARTTSAHPTPRRLARRRAFNLVAREIPVSSPFAHLSLPSNVRACTPSHVAHGARNRRKGERAGESRTDGGGEFRKRTNN